jgi:hypothetical protein
LLIVVAFRMWNQVAKVLAVLALLANATLLPAVHFAASGPSYSSASVHASHRHHVRDGDGEEQQPGSTHQVCHFCRLLGVALPPPPNAVIEIVRVPESIGWPAEDSRELQRAPLRTSNLPRAPPVRA